MSLFAQAPLVQKGLEREQNLGKRPVTDVQIIFASAVPTYSDQAGKFSLAFAGKKAGKLVFMTEITKRGYELVNDKELEHVKLSITDFKQAEALWKELVRDAPQYVQFKKFLGIVQREMKSLN